MIHGSLFSGIGGFDLAAEWMGWDNAFHCEWEDFPRKVLSYHFPNAKSYGDIKETDFNVWRGQIDILSGGFPCQPFSTAGKRKGTEDDRYLWGEMLRAIQEISPRWIVGENVRGLVNWNGGMVFDQVCSDLESEGYKVFPILIPAAAVNAPHRRDRIWFIAYSDGAEQKYRQRKDRETEGEIRGDEKGDVFRELSSDGYATNTDKVRLQQCKNSAEMGKRQKEICGEGDKPSKSIKTDGSKWYATDTDSRRLEGTEKIRWDGINVEREGIAWDATDTLSLRLPREEHREESGGLNTEKASGFWFQHFPTQPPICGGNDGIPRELDSITFPKWRNESIKAYGNAIVPQVAYEIFKTISKIDERAI